MHFVNRLREIKILALRNYKLHENLRFFQAHRERLQDHDALADGKKFF